MIRLHDLAHARSGDKGDIAQISVIAHDPADYPRLAATLTPDRVRSVFQGIVHGPVQRYELPALGALNFVMHQALGGGVTRSLAQDAHGKCLASLLLALELD